MPSISELPIVAELENDSTAGNHKLRRRRRKRKKKKVTAEQILASRYVREWAFGHSEPSDDSAGRVLFELHSHSKFSDGFLSPTALVERAHMNGVKVLALTDHDTMAGIPGAIEAAQKFNMRIIPGVEISAVYSPGNEPGGEEPLHILAYYGSCGPSSMCEELDDLLANIRDGRYTRAQEMLVKLGKLKMPLKWEDVVNIAGKGVAPGRVHVARAMVEAGYVENLKQAFTKYLYDGGPAYAKGTEPLANYVVQLICRSGGIATLAHPWALKSPVSVIESLKAAGLHAVEVYRSDGKLAGFSNLADTYDLLKLGGSDYHGRKADDESDLGSVYLPVLDVFKFLKLASPIWCGSTRNILRSFVEEPSAANMKKKFSFYKPDKSDCCAAKCCGKDCFDLRSSSWLSDEERQNAELENIRLKLSDTVISKVGLHLRLDGR
ncbi:hypothetical protein KFK09_013160 [Dendrobium nobile]|uniref:Polymerase/histidinol phosphatase N-terminal domain-containing protein n=1 Tax=Dendrobium nobile TaxID=94219 RepID=A0A8T3B8T4_DENNO|nr:hypothetical protein KFK09_013160 [Dendrobium nobile]